ncbi:MAG: RNA methyltransferase [Pseudomonadota bacterium]
MKSALEQIRIVLVRPQHPGNIGAAARAMMTMGLSRLVLVQPERFPHSQAVAQSSGATGILDEARVVETIEQATEGCVWVVAASARPRHLGDEPLTPWECAERVVGATATGEVALMFGPERTGLDNEDLERCHATTMIPANPKYSSLNLAQAVQVFSYELRRAAQPEVPKVSRKHGLSWYAPSTAEQMEGFFEHLEKVLLGTGFIDPANPRLLMRRLRQIYNRARPDKNELNMLRGVLSSVEKPKLRRSKKRSVT